GTVANNFNFSAGWCGPNYIGTTVNWTMYAIRFNVFACPSDTPQYFIQSGRPKYNYGANWGNTNMGQLSIGTVNYLPAPFAPNKSVTVSDIRDGTSNTLLCSELIQSSETMDQRSEWWNDVDMQ